MASIFIKIALLADLVILNLAAFQHRVRGGMLRTEICAVDACILHFAAP